MFDFDALSHAIARRTVLCVGDLMLDEFVYGEVSRISPEAPAPVIAVQRSETNVGGAGYNGGFTALEDAVALYVKGYLDSADRFR